MKYLKRLLSILCCVVLLPLSSFPPLAEAEGSLTAAPGMGSQRLDETTHITSDLLVTDPLLLTDGASLVLESGSLTVAPEGIITGNLEISGASTHVDIGGTVNGNIVITSPDADIRISGTVNGQVSVENLDALTDQQGVILSLDETARVQSVFLDGIGNMYFSGTIGEISTSTSNQMHASGTRAKVGTFYARSDAQYNLSDASQLDFLVMDCVDVSDGSKGYINNFGVYDLSHVGSAVVNSGWLDFYDGVTADHVVLRKGSYLHADCAYYSSPEQDASETPSSAMPPVIHELYNDGATRVFNRGKIDYAYFRNSELYNAGSFDTLILESTYLDNEYGARYGSEEEKQNNYWDIFDNEFTYHADTLIAISSDINANDGSIFNAVLSERSHLSWNKVRVQTLAVAGGNTYGWISDEAEIGAFEAAGESSLNVSRDDVQPPVFSGNPDGTHVRGGDSTRRAVELTHGLYQAEGKYGDQYFTIPCEAYSVLSVHFEPSGDYSSLLIQTADGQYA